VSHHRLQRDLSAYLDEELAPEAMSEVRGHLEQCSACQAELDGLREIRRLLGRLEAPELPRGFDAALRSRVDRPEGGRYTWWPRWAWWPRPRVALAAAALAAVLVAVPLVRSHRDRLRAAEFGPDVFIRAAAQAAADDPFADRAFLALVTTDASLRLAGEDPRETSR
jgi:anti-sigma factor RsiW